MPLLGKRFEIRPGLHRPRRMRGGAIVLAVFAALLYYGYSSGNIPFLGQLIAIMRRFCMQYFRNTCKRCCRLHCHHTSLTCHQYMHFTQCLRRTYCTRRNTCSKRAEKRKPVTLSLLI